MALATPEFERDYRLRRVYIYKDFGDELDKVIPLLKHKARL
jgi:hypothetical protein